jgi:hypothetical protein
MRTAWLTTLGLLTIAPSAPLDLAGETPTYDFRIVSYDLTYEIDAALWIFTSTQDIKIINASGHKVDRMYFLLHPDLLIDDIALRDDRGRRLRVKGWKPCGLQAAFPRPLQIIQVQTARAIAPGKRCTLHLEYHLPTTAFKHDLVGIEHILDLTINTGSSFAVGPSSGHYARFNRNLAAPFKLTVKCPEGYYCCVPGNLVSTVIQAGCVIETYLSPTPNIPAFSCAPYQKIVRQVDDLTLEYYLYAGQPFSDEMAAISAQIIQLYTSTFGNIGAHTYRFGTVGPRNSHLPAWENKGNAIYFTDLATREYTLSDDAKGMFIGFTAHELFHNWNLFSVHWTGKLMNWFEEGGANFIGVWACEQLFSEQQGVAARTFFTSTYDGSYGFNGYDARETLESVHKNGMSNPELVLIYYYGALVWEQLRQKVGEEALFAALGDFFRTYAFQTVSYQDFIRCLQARTDVPVAEYLDQWIKYNARIDLSLGQVNVHYTGDRYRTDVEILVDADQDYDLLTSIGYRTSPQDKLTQVDVSLTRPGVHQVSFESLDRPVFIQIDPDLRVPQVNLSNNVWTPPSTPGRLHGGLDRTLNR